MSRSMWRENGHDYKNIVFLSKGTEKERERENIPASSLIKRKRNHCAVSRSKLSIQLWPVLCNQHSLEIKDVITCTGLEYLKLLRDVIAGLALKDMDMLLIVCKWFFISKRNLPVGQIK